MNASKTASQMLKAVAQIATAQLSAPRIANVTSAGSLMVQGAIDREAGSAQADRPLSGAATGLGNGWIGAV